NSYASSPSFRRSVTARPRCTVDDRRKQMQVGNTVMLTLSGPITDFALATDALLKNADGHGTILKAYLGKL
ncbi:hypothetical protein, partial [Pseudomonas amygdali]|uniref:hypothetical protein n=1 Tax=Pseudomonas amygdali TaxID=47877 RepID=UPI001EE43B36